MSSHKIEPARRDKSGRAEPKKASARRDATGEAAADRELTAAELDAVAAAGSDSNRSNL